MGNKPPGRPRDPNSRRSQQEAKRLAELENLRAEMEAKARAEIEAKEAETARLLAEKETEMQKRLAEIEAKEAETARLLAEKETEMQKHFAEIERQKTSEKEAKMPMDTDLEDYGNNFGEEDAEIDTEIPEDFDFDSLGIDFDDEDEPTGEDEEPTLLDQLGQKTETKNASNRKPIEQPDADDDRFEVPPGAKFHIEDGGTPDSVDAMMDADEGAMLLITAVDGIQKWILPKIAENEFLTRAERRRLRQIIHHKGKTLELDDFDLDLLDKAEELDDYCREVPLKPEEIKNLHTPLKKMMVGRGITVSPGFAFILALVMVMMPRLWPIFSKKMENRKKSKEAKASSRSHAPAPEAEAVEVEAENES